MSARIMQILAALAKKSALQTLHTLCETQHRISTHKLDRYLDDVGEVLAGYAYTLRIEYDALQKAHNAALAELAALKGGREAATNRKTWSPAATGFSCLHCGTARAYHDMQTFCPTGPAFASGSSSAKPVAPPAQASAWGAERYTCIGKGGSYLRVGTSIGAGDNRGEIVEVYRDESNGQLYHRDTENFFVRMTAAPTPGASDGKDGKP